MKTLYKFIKIAGIIVLSFIILMIIAVVIAKIYEDKLAAFTIEKLENEINAPMSIGKVSLIPIFSFPRISTEINKLYIGDPDGQKNDTIFYINSLKLGLDTWDLINGVYTIDKLEISGLDFEYTIDKSGKSNIDFLIDAFVDPSADTETDTTATNLDLSAEKLILENIQVRYYDSLTNTGAQVSIPEITIKAKTNDSKFSGKTNGSFVLSHCQYQDTKVDQMESCTVTFILEYENKEATIKDLSISSEGIVLGVEGLISNSDGLALNAIIEASTLDFNILKKYAPNQQMSFFEDINLTQKEPINLDLKLNYKDNNLAIEEFLLRSDGIDLGLSGILNNTDTISIDANIESFKLDFGDIKKYIPLRYFEQYGIIDIGGMMDISAKIVGDYNDSTIIPIVDADVNIKNIRIKSVDYPQIDTLKLEGHINLGEKSDLSEATIHIYNHELISPSSHVHMNGRFNDFQNPKFQMSSISYLNVAEFEKLIPDSFAKNMKGSIIAEFSTSGIVPEKYSDDFIDDMMDNSIVSMQFKEVTALLFDSIQIDNFSTQIRYTPQESKAKEIQIDQLNLNSETLNINLHNTSLSTTLFGKLSDPLHMGLHIKSCIIQNGKSKITGSGKVSNFGNPTFDINTNITLQLDELKPFVPDSMVKDMSGLAYADINSHGNINLDSLDSQLLPIIFENSRFNLTFDNISLAFPDSMMNMDSISAQLALKDDILDINYFSTNYHGLKLGMDSSKILNLYKAVLLNQKEELYINTNIEIGDLYFDDFKHFMAPASKETEKPSQEITTDEQQNWSFLIHGSASVNSIIIDSLKLDDININLLHINDMTSLFKLTDSSYIIDQFKFKVFEGEMNNSIHYKIRKDGTQSVSTHNLVSNMNMRTVLQNMDNFGMDSLISYENISGLLSIDLNTFIPIDDSIRLDKMMISGDITLEKGGVFNFAPAQEISKFTSIKELDNIQFKTLRSNIFMFKNKLYVPRTNIVSNAIDIAAFGMQSLEGDSEYHMEMHLSNILFGKSKRRNKKQDKSGEEVDEESLKKSSRKIIYAVTEGKSKVGLDSKEKREDMMNKIRVQKKMLDFIFFPKNIHYNTDPE